MADRLRQQGSRISAFTALLVAAWIAFNGNVYAQSVGQEGRQVTSSLASGSRLSTAIDGVTTTTDVNSAATRVPAAGPLPLHVAALARESVSTAPHEQTNVLNIQGPEAGWDQYEPGTPLILSGFWEVRAGARLRDDPHERRVSIAEGRVQLDFAKNWPQSVFKLTVDLLADPLLDSHKIDLEDGTGLADLRQLNYSATLSDKLDIKIGRQILTWGTGDLLFINDLFPKDWNAFLIGREISYLKAPSDAAKIAMYSPWGNADLVYTPRFDPDRYIDGSRASFFDPLLGRIAGRDAVAQTQRPDTWFNDDEIALRLNRNFNGNEVALYAYDGFWKSPAGMDPVGGEFTFPRLSVYGASVRGFIGPAIVSVEIGYYRSRDDRNGDNPFARNDEQRLLFGYEREIAKELTLGLQYYHEHMEDYAAYVASLPAGVAAADKDRQVYTARLTKFLLNQTLTASLFTEYSPTDQDGYVRPHVQYKINDRWITEVGANVFFGNEDHTFFGQLKDNNNVYASVRYGF